MTPIEIVVIIAAVLIVLAVIGSYIYKKIKKLPTGECACCKSNMKHAIKKMRKDMKKEKCCCTK